MKIFKAFFLFPGILGVLFQAYTQEKFITPFEESDGYQTATYSECIDYYFRLSKKYTTIHIQKIGITDSGYPLHIVMFNANMNFDYTNTSSLKVLVMNAIHPGEPAGVDASMMLVRDLAMGKISSNTSQNIMLSVIPVYNIGGSLNRSSFSRANQNGPEEYGFRGNAKNLDLNRDFIKMDTRNARSFVEYFHQFDPEIFVDTHTSNGADYQYKITCLETHPQKLGGSLGLFQKEIFTPSVFKAMKKKGYEMCPFVNIYGKTPDHGYEQFFDYPRFSTGYTALFQTLGYMPEAHMLKAFTDRVLATYSFLVSLLETGNKHREVIKSERAQDRQDIIDQKNFIVSWTIDKDDFDSISFKGYKAVYKKSKITGAERLYYAHEQPYEMNIPYFNKLLPQTTIVKPKAYIIQQAWGTVIEHLEANNIQYSRFLNDTIMDVEIYYINDFDTYQSAYEGHYPHYNTSIKSMFKTISIRKGDYLVPTNQPGAKYLVETLEPESPDSFFNWNFFESILQQKEHISDYVFEETAEKILNNNPWLKDSLNNKKQIDEDFRNNSRAQLNYIYRHSDFFEKTYKLYPVLRILNKEFISN